MTNASVPLPWRRFLRTAVLVLAISYAVPLASGLYVLALAPDDNFCDLVPKGSGPLPFYLPLQSSSFDCKVKFGQFFAETGAMAAILLLAVVMPVAWALDSYWRKRRPFSQPSNAASSAGARWLRLIRYTLAALAVSYAVPLTIGTFFLFVQPDVDVCAFVAVDSGPPPFYLPVDEYRDCRIKFVPFFVVSGAMAVIFVLPAVGLIAWAIAWQRSAKKPDAKEA